MAKAGLRRSRNRRAAFAWAIAFFAACSTGCRRHDRGEADRTIGEIQAQIRAGHISQALNRSRGAARGWRDRASSETYVTFKLLEAEALIREGQIPAAHGLLAALQIAPAESPLEVERETMLARTLMGTRARSEARAILDRACQTASSHGWNSALIKALIAKGLLLTKEGQTAAGEDTLRQALKLPEERHDQSQRMGIFLNLGMNRLKRDAFDDAIPYFEKAQIAGESAGELEAVSFALGDQAICYYKLGNFERALNLVNQAIAIKERIEAKKALIYSYGELGNIYFTQRELPRAVQKYEQALHLARDLGADDGVAFITPNLASAYIELREWDKAAKLNQEANATGNKSSVPYRLLNSAAIAAGRGQQVAAIRLYNEAISLPEAPPSVVWEAHAGIANLYATRGDQAQASRHFESALQTIEQARSGLSRNDYKLTFLSQLIRFYQDYVDLLIDRGENLKALAVAGSSRARLLAERLDINKTYLAGTNSPDLQAIAKSSHSILVFYWITSRRSLAWIITPDQTRLEILPENGAAIQNLVDLYSAEVAHGMRDPAADGSAAGARLYEILVRPLLSFILSGAKVIVVPDGPLHNLNFETLPVPGPHPHYWIEDVTLSVAPSLALLARRDTERTRPHGVLLIGDPQPDQQYPRLLYASREIDAVRRHFPGAGTKVLTGLEATPAVYRGTHPERFSLIHFTAHAEANSESPLDSAVILSRQGDEYKLYGRDVLGTGLRAELVTVSACKSAGAKSYSGEGLIGFAWAFLHAGAKNVIAGLWDVDDGSTPRLMDRMYAGLAAGAAPDRALRDAKLELIHSTGNYRKPYYWGALQVYRRTAD